jgi:hypothetical protein
MQVWRWGYLLVLQFRIGRRIGWAKRGTETRSKGKHGVRYFGRRSNILERGVCATRFRFRNLYGAVRAWLALDSRVYLRMRLV